MLMVFVSNIPCGELAFWVVSATHPMREVVSEILAAGPESREIVQRLSNCSLLVKTKKIRASIFSLKRPEI
jgi:hypothetical protein